MKDGIALVERGIPAVSLITEVFWGQGQALSAALGWPGFPRVQLPYPIWGSGADNMSAVANRVVPAIIAELDGSGTTDA